MFRFINEVLFTFSVACPYAPWPPLTGKNWLQLHAGRTYQSCTDFAVASEAVEMFVRWLAREAKCVVLMPINLTRECNLCPSIGAVLVDRHAKSCKDGRELTGMNVCLGPFYTINLWDTSSRLIISTSMAISRYPLIALPCWSQKCLDASGRLARHGVSLWCRQMEVHWCVIRPKVEEAKTWTHGSTRWSPNSVYDTLDNVQ